jgi:hypothetical protein
MPNRFSVLAVWGLLLFANAAVADTFAVSAGRSLLEFDRAAGLPVRWLVCESACSDAGARSMELFAPGDGTMRVLSPQGPGGIFWRYV